MSFTVQNLNTAAQILSDRKANAENTRAARRLKILKDYPVIAQYEAQLSKTGLEVAKALSMGEDAEKYINDLAAVNLTVQKKIKEELKKNGLPEDYLEIPYVCKKCSDSGFIDGIGCSCRRNLLIELTVKDLENVSPASKCRFDNFSLEYYSDKSESGFESSPKEKMEEIFEYCKDYAADFHLNSESLYLYGATGLGKTHLSLAIANVVVRNGYNVLYGSAQNILSRLEKEKFSGNKTDYEQEILDCDLLIIDDLGSEFSTNYTVSAIYNIINTRINLSKPVIISTNLDEAELEKKYTQRITSRIIGSYTPILFIGKDVRQIKNM